MMDLERAVRRAKTQSLFVLTLTVLLSGLAIGYSYRLGEANAELEEMKTRLSKVTAQHAVTIAGRQLRRTEMDSADKNFLQFEAHRTGDSPATAEDHYVQGVQAFVKHDYEAAQARFTRALMLRPDWAEVYLARGRNLSALKLYQEAIQDLSKGLALADEPQLYAARCFDYLKLGQLEKALQDCSQAINGDPYDWVPFNYRGFINYLLGNDRKAVRDWERAATYRSQPSSKAESLENLGLVYLRVGEWRRALDQADYVSMLSGKSAWNYLFRGIAADQLGEENVAANALDAWRQFRTPSDIQAMRSYLPTPLHGYLESENPDPELGS